VKEAALLVAVQRIVGGIQIERNLRRRFHVCVQEQVDEHRLNGIGVGGELGVAGGFGPAQFQPVQRALAGQRRAVRPPCGELAGQRRQHRVMTQFVMVNHVLGT
jgi:hypothetical protein